MIWCWHGARIIETTDQNIDRCDVSSKYKLSIFLRICVSGCTIDKIAAKSVSLYFAPRYVTTQSPEVLCRHPFHERYASEPVLAISV